MRPRRRHYQPVDVISSSLPGIRTCWCSRMSQGSAARYPTIYAGSQPAAASAYARCLQIRMRPCSGGARPIMAEGISNFAVEADLRDRSVICVIDPLAERKLDEELASEFERACPGILGALLDLMVLAVRELPDARL